jgi:uncharacterized membrane protein
MVTVSNFIGYSGFVWLCVFVRSYVTYVQTVVRVYSTTFVSRDFIHLIVIAVVYIVIVMQELSITGVP